MIRWFLIIWAIVSGFGIGAGVTIWWKIIRPTRKR